MKMVNRNNRSRTNKNNNKSVMSSTSSSMTMAAFWVVTLTTITTLLFSSSTSTTTSFNSMFLTMVEATGAYQSGPNAGSLYSGGLSTSQTTSDVFVTGISYAKDTTTKTGEPSCFVARIDSRALQNPVPAAIIGNGNVLEACHAVDYLAHGDVESAPRVVIVGNSDPGGLFGNADAPAGFVMTLDPSSDFNIVTGAPLASTDVTRNSYPVQVVADETTNAIFVSLLTSNNIELSPDYARLEVADGTAEVDWLRYRKYGSAFEMTFQRFDYDPSADQIQETWTATFPIDVEPDGVTKPDVYLAGHIFKHSTHNSNAQSSYQVLIVAGSTRGMGAGYGNAEGDDEDGFLTLLDPTTGSLMDVSNVPQALNNNGDVNTLPALTLARNNERIGTAQDDIITGICDDPSSDHHFYIVGATKGGDMGDRPDTVDSATAASTNPESLQGFVQKIDIRTLGQSWGVQWAATKPSDNTAITAAVAMTCLVDADRNVVYVAGLAQNDAVVLGGSSTTTSNGGDDIWVAQLDTSDGTMNWMQQIGTAGDESLALGGALGLDDVGDLIVLGSTNGPFYRPRENVGTPSFSDIFLVTLDQIDGEIPPVGNPLEQVNLPTAAPIPAPTTGEGNGVIGSIVDHEDGKATLDFNLGLQSGPSVGPLYSGGMVYDINNDVVYITGIGYDPDFDEFDNPDPNVVASQEPLCLVAKVSLSDGKIWDWEEWFAYGNPDLLESCNSISLHRESEVVVVGSSAPGSDFLGGASSVGQSAGFALALSRTDLAQIDSTALLTTDPLDRFQYPMDVLSDGNDLYIISLTSTDALQTSDAAAASGTKANWITTPTYGTSLDMTVTKLSLREETIDGISDGAISFNTQWSQEFPVQVDPATGTTPRVYIGGSFLSQGRYLAVSGSTRGLGPVYGAAVGDDEDGFITLLDLETGELASDVSRNTIREGSAEDDIVTGICPDPNDPAVFYITGATKGVIGTQLSTRPMAPDSLQGFLRKVNADNLREIWTVQWGALAAGGAATNVYAQDCAVFDQVVYVGGVVLNNAGMVVGNDVRASYGGDDIWMGQVSTEDGSVNWLHQVGSAGDDHLAPYGGVVASKEGHGIAFGDTTGAAYRDRAVDGDMTDLLLMSFDNADGSYGDVTGNFEEQQQQPQPQPTLQPQAAPTPAPVPTTDPPVGSPTQANPQPVALQPTISADAWNGNAGAPSEGLSTGAIVGIVIAVLLVVGIAVWYLICRRKKTRSKNLDDMDGGSITFDVEHKINKDGLIVSAGNGTGSYKDQPAWATPSSSTSSRGSIGGLGGMMYSDEPLGGPNLQVGGSGGYSDLKNKGREVI